MKAEDFEMHELVLRHLKGIVKAYETWLRRKVADQSTTVPARASRLGQKSETQNV